MSRAIVIQIEKELRSLVAECKKKHQDVKDSAERAIEKLAAVASTPAGAGHTEVDLAVLQDDLTLRPFLLACATKVPKLTTKALSAIQSLISVKAISPPVLAMIFGTLRIQSESDDEGVQLKILQTLLLAINPQSGLLGSDSLWQSSLAICFRLHGAKSAIIRSTSFSALRQVVTMMFDGISERSQDEGEQPLPAQTSSQKTSKMLVDEFRSVFLLLTDIIHICRGSEGGEESLVLLNNSKTQIPQSVGVELLEMILRNYAGLFGRVPALALLLKDEMCPLLFKLLRCHHDFPMVLRLVRCTSVIIQSYHRTLISELEIFWAILVSFLTPETPVWHSVLVMETLLGLCESPSLVYFCFTHYDLRPPSTPVLANIVAGLSTLMQHHLMQLEEAQPILPGRDRGAKVAENLWLLQKNQAKGMTMLSDNNAPVYSELYPCWIGLKCITELIRIMALLAVQATEQKKKDTKAEEEVDQGRDIGANGEDGKQGESLAIMVDEKVSTSCVRQLVERVHVPVVQVLDAMLQRAILEAQVQHILMLYQSLTNTAGVLLASKPRDLLLASLCKIALPVNLDRFESHLMMRRLDSAEARNALLVWSKQQNAGANGNDFEFDGSNLVVNNAPGAVSRNRAPLLSGKNIQACKALFNIAHCLGSLLGQAWLQVLETFEKLDMIIQASHDLEHVLRREHASDSLFQDILPVKEEVQILEQALSRLFESTKFLDDTAILHVLGALGTLSLTALARAATHLDKTTSSSSSGSDTNGFFGSGDGGAEIGEVVIKKEGGDKEGKKPKTQTAAHGGDGASLENMRRFRMFSVTYLVDTIECNLFRVQNVRLWDIAVGHLNCVIHHKDPDIRVYGVTALAKLTVDALTSKALASAPPASRTAAASASSIGEKKMASALLSPVQCTSYASDYIRSLTRTNLSPHEAKMSRFLTSQLQENHISPNYFQLLLLDPLLELYRSKYDETRQVILESVLLILQSAGQMLTTGWSKVLPIIQMAATGPDRRTSGTSRAASPTLNPMPTPSRTPSDVLDASAAAIAVPPLPKFIELGYKCLQLVVQDFIICLPLQCFQYLTETVGWFCIQSVDANIAFASIGLLWTIADHLHRLSVSKLKGVDSPATSTATTTTAAPVGLTELPEGDENENVTPQQLLTSVYAELRQLCLDPRAEVRLSAMQTLQSSLTAHVSLMDEETAVFVLECLIFPLLESLLTLHTATNAAVQQEQISVTLGKKKNTGKSVMMMLHHSRDTAEKQWEETRVLALQGSAPVFRQFFKLLHSSSHPAFERCWTRLLTVLRDCCSRKNTSPKTANAAVSCLTELLTAPQSHSFLNDPQHPLRLWQHIITVHPPSSSPNSSADVEDSGFFPSVVKDLCAEGLRWTLTDQKGLIVVTKLLAGHGPVLPSDYEELIAGTVVEDSPTLASANLAMSSMTLPSQEWESWLLRVHCLIGCFSTLVSHSSTRKSLAGLDKTPGKALHKFGYLAHQLLLAVGGHAWIYLQSHLLVNKYKSRYKNLVTKEMKDGAQKGATSAETGEEGEKDRAVWWDAVRGRVEEIAGMGGLNTLEVNCQTAVLVLIKDVLTSCDGSGYHTTSSWTPWLCQLLSYIRGGAHIIQFFPPSASFPSPFSPPAETSAPLTFAQVAAEELPPISPVFSAYFVRKALAVWKDLYCSSSFSSASSASHPSGVTLPLQSRHFGVAITSFSSLLSSLALLPVLSGTHLTQLAPLASSPAPCFDVVLSAAEEGLAKALSPFPLLLSPSASSHLTTLLHETVNAVLSTIQVGLHALSSCPDALSPIEKRRVWAVICDLFTRFLGDHRSTGTGGGTKLIVSSSNGTSNNSSTVINAKALNWPGLQMKLLTALVDDVFPRAGTALPAVQWSLLQLLNSDMFVSEEGVEVGEGHNGNEEAAAAAEAPAHLNMACLKGMFSICALPAPPLVQAPSAPTPLVEGGANGGGKREPGEHMVHSPDSALDGQHVVTEETSNSTDIASMVLPLLMQRCAQSILRYLELEALIYPTMTYMSTSNTTATTTTTTTTSTSAANEARLRLLSSKISFILSHLLALRVHSAVGKIVLASSSSFSTINTAFSFAHPSSVLPVSAVLTIGAQGKAAQLSAGSFRPAPYSSESAPASTTNVNSDLTDAIPLRRRSKVQDPGCQAHLIKLMPVFVRCVTFHDPELRLLLAAVMTAAVKEMGL